MGVHSTNDDWQLQIMLYKTVPAYCKGLVPAVYSPSMFLVSQSAVMMFPSTSIPTGGAFRLGWLRMLCPEAPHFTTVYMPAPPTVPSAPSVPGMAVSRRELPLRRRVMVSVITCGRKEMSQMQTIKKIIRIIIISVVLPTVIVRSDT